MRMGWTRPKAPHVLAKPCLHCGHNKGKHVHKINHSVPFWHPARVRYYCVEDCQCRSHSDYTRKVS